MKKYIFFRKIIRRRRVRKIARKLPNRSDYLLRKEAARRFVIDRLEFFSNKYTLLDQSNIESLKYKRISIRNQRSRWGSCSSRKNLNFNYKIIDLAPELQDYIIVHELCHLKELHHGKAFWDLMKLTIPQAEEYHQIVRKIRTIE